MKLTIEIEIEMKIVFKIILRMKMRIDMKIKMKTVMKMKMRIRIIFKWMDLRQRVYGAGVLKDIRNIGENMTRMSWQIT